MHRTKTVPPSPKTEFPPRSERPCHRLYEHAFLVGDKQRKAGVYLHTWRDRKTPKGETIEELVDIWICSVLRVIAITRTDAGTEYAYLIEFIPHGKTEKRREVLSQALLLGRPEDALKVLRDLGVGVLHEHAAEVRNYLDREYLRFDQNTPELFWESTKCIGWHGEKTFVLPSEIIGTQNKVWFSGRGDIAQYTKHGTLDDWQQKVALPCLGNPYLITGLSFSFVGPLLELLNIPGIAIHYFGDSTSGKTSAQFLAASTWGSPRFLLTWSGTVNGLESQASSRSSTLTLLDESHLIDPRQLDAGIYLLLNGVAKSRMARDATAKSIARWFAAILSSGERSTQAHLTTKTTDHKAGQGVRMIDVPVIARYGIFDSLHNWASAKEFAENLKEAAAQDYGHAGPLFVEYLINNKANLDLKRD